MTPKRFFKRINIRWLVLSLGALCILGIITLCALNHIIIKDAKGRIFQDIEHVPKRSVAIVLGAGVMKDGAPSTALKDRLYAALVLWRTKKIKRVLLTGDHGTKQYNELQAMHRWLVARQVPAQIIFTDHAGFRTFDSMRRARQIFEVKDAIVCTQRFHLARSLYLAKHNAIDAIGFVADRHIYRKRHQDATREFIARAIAFGDLHIWRRRPRFLGPKIPIMGSAEKSYDQSLRTFLKNFALRHSE